MWFVLEASSVLEGEAGDGHEFEGVDENENENETEEEVGVEVLLN